MALQIDKDHEGKKISYWRIVRLYFNIDEKDLIAELRGYMSKAKSDEAKTGAKTSELQYKFTLSGLKFPNVDKASFMKDVYKEIKASTLYGGWSSAQDV